MPVNLSTIQASTILIAAATFFGAIVGALANVGIRWFERRERRQKVRRAIRAEITSTDLLSYIEEKEPSIPGIANITPLTSTKVFEEYLDDIGNLSHEEVHYIILYYTGLENLELAVEEASGIINKGDELKSELIGEKTKLQENEGETTLEEQIEIIEDIQSSEREDFLEGLDALSEAREEALNAIEKRL